MARLFALLLVALGLAPGTWWRSPLPPVDNRQHLSFTPLRLPEVDLGPLELAGAWQLRSRNPHFGSYSALLALGDGTLLAASDRGRVLRFTPPGVRPSRVRFEVFSGRVEDDKTLADIEALARDPASGRIWAAFEVTNRIERRDAALGAGESVAPEAMRPWRAMFGAEAMVRLADGRFVVLAEGGGRGDAVPALLFPGDPVAGAEPIGFGFGPPTGFRPVDMAQLADGRVLILLRRVEWGVPPGFSGKLLLADPAAIRAGRPWPAQFLADLAEPLPTDNYEGLAVEPDGHGGWVLWLISDDNEMTLQRTLLLKLVWRPRAKARGIARAPR